MTTTFVRILIVVAAVIVSGCPSSHADPDAAHDAGMDGGGVGGVDGDRRLVQLTDAEWTALCEWLASAAPSPTYYCDGTAYLGPDVDACSGCAFYDARSEACQGQQAPYWRAQPATCETTVAAWAVCWGAMARLPCWMAFMPPTSCDDATCQP